MIDLNNHTMVFDLKLQHPDVRKTGLKNSFIGISDVQDSLRYWKGSTTLQLISSSVVDKSEYPPGLATAHGPKSGLD
jgi:hypothetical protein